MHWIHWKKMEISLDILDTLDIFYIPPLKQTLKVPKNWMPFPDPGASAARRMASRGSRWSRWPAPCGVWTKGSKNPRPSQWVLRSCGPYWQGVSEKKLSSWKMCWGFIWRSIECEKFNGFPRAFLDIFFHGFHFFWSNHIQPSRVETES